MASTVILEIDPNIEFSASMITCPHCGKRHAALDFTPVDVDTWGAACPETGETIRLRLAAERRLPGPSEVK